MAWMTLGRYEYEYDENGCCTGWCRCVGGRMANGRWPEFNSYTGVTR